MAKRHHYVPKLHLRQFSDFSDKKRISLFDFTRDKLIPISPIRTQACEPDFYIIPEFEEALSVIESNYGKNLPKILDSESLPEHGSEGHKALLQYIMLQRLRTPYAELEATEVLKHILRNDVRSDPLLTSIAQTDYAYPSLMDLRMILLKNGTENEFITSDVPVIFYNQLFERKSLPLGGTGLSALGLQVVFPFSSRYSLLLFDADVYKVSGDNNFIQLSNKKDVENFNKLHIVEAYQQVFFSSSSASYVQELVRKYGKRRRSQIVTEVSVKSDGIKQQIQSPLARFDNQCRLRLSFISIKRSYLTMRMTQGKPYCRKSCNQRRPSFYSRYFPDG